MKYFIESDSTTGQNANMRFLKTRSLFGEEHCYVIDATFGNCGRFLNVSTLVYDSERAHPILLINMTF